jgi:hypothetical protein
MRMPPVTAMARLSLRAAEAAPGTAVRLLADDRAVAVARRATGRAGLRRAVAGRRVVVVGPAPAVERLREAGAHVVEAAPAEAPKAVASATPDVLVLYLRPVAPAAETLDLDAADASLHETYYGTVRTVLAALPTMRAARGGQIIVATAADPHPSAADRGATSAATAFMRIVSAEVVGDGVLVTQVHLPHDPERAERRLCEAIALRPRVAPVRLPF